MNFKKLFNEKKANFSHLKSEQFFSGNLVYTCLQRKKHFRWTPKFKILWLCLQQSNQTNTLKPKLLDTTGWKYFIHCALSLFPLAVSFISQILHIFGIALCQLTNLSHNALWVQMMKGCVIGYVTILKPEFCVFSWTHTWHTPLFQSKVFFNKFIAFYLSNDKKGEVT